MHPPSIDKDLAIDLTAAHAGEGAHVVIANTRPDKNRFTPPRVRAVAWSVDATARIHLDGSAVRTGELEWDPFDVENGARISIHPDKAQGSEGTSPASASHALRGSEE